MAHISRPVALTLTLALALVAFGGAVVAQDSSFDVELGDGYIDMPETFTAGSITFNVSNVGTMPHSLIIEGEGVNLTMPETLTSDQSTTWTVDLEPGTYVVWCPIGNHRALGMEVTITVEAAQAEPTPTEAAADPTATESPAAGDPTATTTSPEDEYTAPPAEATPTALPGLPNTGAGGTQDGTSPATVAGIVAALLVITAAGGGLLYRWQRNMS